jgi:hypothetical protein
MGNGGSINTGVEVECDSFKSAAVTDWMKFVCCLVDCLSIYAVASNCTAMSKHGELAGGITCAHSYNISLT